MRTSNSSSTNHAKIRCRKRVQTIGDKTLVKAHAVRSDHFPTKFSHCGLEGARSRLLILLAISLKALQKRVVVQFAMGRKGPFLSPHKERRNHIRRQALGPECEESSAEEGVGRPSLSDKERQQAALVRSGRAWQ